MERRPVLGLREGRPGLHRRCADARSRQRAPGQRLRHRHQQPQGAAMTVRTLFAAAALTTLTALAALLTAAATVAIVNATILTADKAGTLTGATLLMRDTKIVAVGRGVAVPPGATVIDGSGKFLTPGMFAPLSALGVVEIDAVGETNDRPSAHKRYGPALDMSDAFNPLSHRIPIARVDGVTRAMVAPTARRGGNVLVGQGAVVSLGSTSAWLVKPRAAMFAAFGEEGASLSGTRASAVLALREQFEEVRDAARPARPRARAEPRQPAVAPGHRGHETGDGLGQVPLVISANRASDILAAIALARQYKLRLVIAGGAEAWLVAPQLAAYQADVIIDPLLQLPEGFDSLSARSDNASLLAAAGCAGRVQFRPDRHLQCAQSAPAGLSNAIRFGLDPATALAAITLNPARMYGVDGQLGSLAAGKLADVVLWDGDPFELASYPGAVFIGGERMGDDTRQSALRDKYMRLHRLKD
ncbi:amidohydrolase family protein [Massilia sp. H-1]|nr:amidohydrolase family protein [Massilia sp. H-1]